MQKHHKTHTKIQKSGRINIRRNHQKQKDEYKEIRHDKKPKLHKYNKTKP